MFLLLDLSAAVLLLLFILITKLLELPMIPSRSLYSLDILNALIIF